VAFKQVDDGIRIVSFMHYDKKQGDLPTEAARCIDSPPTL
jgi:hypothetical protein